MEWEKHLSSIIPWGGSILTGIFTLIAVYITQSNANRQFEARLSHENAKERREVLRSRLEELYALVGDWSRNFVIYHTTFRRVMDGKITYNDALDITIKNHSKFDANRLFTLVDLYFPESRPEFETIKELRSEANAIQSEFKEYCTSIQTSSHEYSEAITAVLERFNMAVERYKESLSAYTKDV